MTEARVRPRETRQARQLGNRPRRAEPAGEVLSRRRRRRGLLLVTLGVVALAARQHFAGRLGAPWAAA